MKIVHICLANFFIDGFSYQENMLPKFHKLMGHNVEIIASLFTFDSNGKGTYLLEANKYVNEHGILITRLEYKNKFSKRLRKYKGMYEAIKNAEPDVIFIHGCQFLDIKYIIKYVKKNPNVKVYVDNHADFNNSAKNWLSKNILHKIIWRRCAQRILPYTEKFYGVLPIRVSFLIDVYKLPANKVDLLVMGADDEKVKEAKSNNLREEIRGKYNIADDDFLIMTGGKIDNNKKETIELMRAVKSIGNKKIKLIVFGSVIEELKSAVQNLNDDKTVQYIGWINSNESYSYFAASDLVIFPGKHSVFWEQVVGLGLPMIVRHWEGVSHIDLGGNVCFLKSSSGDEMQSAILGIYRDPKKYKEMRKIAIEKGMEKFSYSKIARKSIQ